MPCEDRAQLVLITDGSSTPGKCLVHGERESEEGGRCLPGPRSPGFLRTHSPWTCPGGAPVSSAGVASGNGLMKPPALSAAGPFSFQYAAHFSRPREKSLWKVNSRNRSASSKFLIRFLFSEGGELCTVITVVPFPLWLTFCLLSVSPLIQVCSLLLPDYFSNPYYFIAFIFL